ncbi:MAG: ribosome biogenesis GTPase Der [Treponemataceae bacterium]
MGKKYTNAPLIVIAGRPNVGKSTLFNRLVGKRRSITDKTAGVTRDLIEETVLIKDKPVRLMDSGGFKLSRSKNESEAVLTKLTIEKTLQSLEMADRILLLLDATSHTAEDDEFVQYLRRYWNKIIVAVNKTEGGRGEAEGYNYLKLGVARIHFISAEHGDNINELLDALVDGLDFSKVCETDDEDVIRLTIVGKPNTGKSTLSNFLTKSSASIVSDIAGTTRDIVRGEFSHKGKKFILQDTAGIRKKSKVNEDIEYYSVVRAIKSLDNADVVLHLIDADSGLTDQDKKICVQAVNRGLPVIFVINKWDTVDAQKGTFKNYERNIKVMFGKMEYAPVCAISAIDGTGINNMLNIVLQAFKQYTTQVETSALNLALKDWLTSYPPPGNKFTFKYLVQTGTRPVRFLIFTNKVHNVTEQYMRYLQNKIRTDLGFSLIPVQLTVRSNRDKSEKNFGGKK